MIPAQRRRGAPLVAFGMIVGSWIAVRVVLLGGWIPLQDLADPVEAIPEAEAEVVTASVRLHAAPTPGKTTWAAVVSRPQGPEPGLAVQRSIDRRPSFPPPASFAFVSAPIPSVSARQAGPIQFAGQSPIVERSEPARRWSADGWLLLRPGGKGGGSLLPTYGASQVGAVLRYRLVPNDGHRTAAYLRLVAALDGSRQREAAAGLSARPIAAIPIVAAAELRLTSDRFATRMRPAVMVYTEMPPFDLAGGLRGEAYLQGGYVAGKGSTGFVDGQIRLDRRLAEPGGGEVRFGGGIWGGAQEGASRLDVGPAVQATFPLSRDLFARAAVDWRFRLAGNAAPTSGPAFTLSAGF